MPFYNTSAPSVGNTNTINSTVINYGIRDYLLNLNLLPVYPWISTAINGSPKIGEPVLDTMVGSGNITTPIGLPLQTNGIVFKDLNVILNTFQNDTPSADALTQINFINTIPNSEFGNSYWPAGVESYPVSATDEVDQYGLAGKTNTAEFRKKNTLKNLYLDVSKQIDMSSFINTSTQITQQIKGYLDEYGGLNLGGGGAIQTANIIGSVLNGQGLGLAKGGVVTNFDIRSSLAGRILGATGLINDTKLGNIGGQQLALALANNAAFNVQQELLGSLNVKDNILSLIKGDDLPGFRPSYKITVPKGNGGRILDTAGKILGFTLPRSYLLDEGSIFQTESGDVDNISRANEMILNTGKGQNEALIKNIKANQNGISPDGHDNPSNTKFRSGYAPAYNDNKGDAKITNGSLYAYNQGGNLIHILGSTDGIIPNLSYNREEKIESYGFNSPEELQFKAGHTWNPGYDERKVSDVSFSWGSRNPEVLNKDITGDYTDMTGDKKSLLVKTQEIFNSIGMRSIVTIKGDMDKTSSQLETANGKGFSKGNAVLKKELFNDNFRYDASSSAKTAEETYCRSWTTLDRYDKVGKMVRSHGLWDKNHLPYRVDVGNSVLDKYGFAKIAPYINDSKTDAKKFMFSIENLAWHDKFEWLPVSERGLGDRTTGKHGRIMWFPPYNIQFNESTSVNWEKNDFIGRGESIYTYNNTERSGTLSFQIVVDHPSYANAFRTSKGPDDHYINSFWAGCIDPNSKLGERLTIQERSDTVSEEQIIPQIKTVTPEPDLIGLKVYFPNDNSSYNLGYENGLSGATVAEAIDYTINSDGHGFGLDGGSVADTTQKDVKGVTKRWADRYNYGFNYSVNSGKTPKITTPSSDVINGFYDPNRVAILGKHLTEICPHCQVEVKGYASIQGYGGSNIKLANKRADTIIKQLKTELTPILKAKGLSDDEVNKRFKKLEGEERPASADCEKQTKANPDPPTDSAGCKQDRYVTVDVKFNQNLIADINVQPDPIIKINKFKVNTKITDKYYNESKYFEQLTDVDPLVFDSFREKIRYFHPAFHSTTPEGLNSRLTFLLQCTRQGPTLEEQGANNLAFGRPPICILRIGDFYNTKIVIDSVNFDYEPLVWDLNPEGIGVQPMIANVTMNFKFIGGSSLMGPINKLQNALSFNYFANTRVYDPRADYISLEKTEPKDASNYENAAGFVRNSDGSSDIDDVVIKASKEWVIKNGETDISESSKEITKKDPILDPVDDSAPVNDQIASAENAVSEVTEAPKEILPIGTTIDDSAVINCFGYEGAYKIDESDPTDILLDIVMYWNAKQDVENPELNNTHKAFVYIEKGKEKVVIGHIKITPNSAGSLIFHAYDDKDGNPTGNNTQLLSFAGQSNKAKIKFEVSFYIEDATKAKFVLDAWNATGADISMIKIAWQEENGAAINAGFSKKWALKFPNEI